MKMIGKIPRDMNNEIQVKTGKYKGIEVIDIRWYYNKDGEMLPATKGFRCNRDEFKHLIGVLKRVEGEQDGLRD
tara:strand:+ start:279 stop:500 length:222 start_codon:yes stop_codon:yes gene_type:complete